MKTHESLEKNLLEFVGIWEVKASTGSLPDAREGLTAAMLPNDNLYMFGGFSRGLYNDIRTVNVTTQKWEMIQTPYNTSPEPRFAHTMIAYDKKLVVFGGAGNYMQSIKMRVSFNDLYIFDTRREEWIRVPEKNPALESDYVEPPKKRMSHAAGNLGCIMLIHGGYTTEQKKVLDDFKLFDVEEARWIETITYF